MKCKHDAGDRKRISPTGRKELMILVDRCHKRGAMLPVEPEKLTWKEKDWIERFNKKG
jgi:hypothetical protein